MAFFQSFEPFQEPSSGLRERPLARHLKSTRTQRRPLQELPISSSGAILGCRAPAIRPIPSIDKENYQAILVGIERRERIISLETRRVARAFHELQLIQRRLERGEVRSRGCRSMVTNRRPATHMNASHRLSMPFESDGSDAEPDLSVLGMARPGGDLAHHASSRMYDDEDDGDETVSQDAYDAEDTSAEENLEVDEDDEEEGDDDDIEDDEDIEDEPMPLVDPASIGLKEISNLGKFTVSSHKQGNGVEELRSDDLKLYWQSDGPQPHRLTVYFVKRVGIRDIRFYVDYSEDESYTPTKIVFKSGTSENNLIEFASLSLENPQGWQQVPIAGAGGEPDGNTLVSYVLQMQILENHQNGKDTHLRGIKIYAFDPDSAQGGGVTERSDLEDIVEMTGSAASQKVEEGTGDKLGDIARAMAVARLEGGDAGFAVPDFMREPEIR